MPTSNSTQIKTEGNHNKRLQQQAQNSANLGIDAQYQATQTSVDEALILTNFFAAAAVRSASQSRDKTTRRSKADARAASLGKEPFTKKEIKDRMQLIRDEHQKELDLKSKADIPDIAEKSDLHERRQLEITINEITINELNTFIEKQKQDNPGQPVDFSSLNRHSLVGKTKDIIPGKMVGDVTSSSSKPGIVVDIAYKKHPQSTKLVHNVVEKLDVSGTNFFEHIDASFVYFLGGDFSKCKMSARNIQQSTFDGSDLTDANIFSPSDKVNICVFHLGRNRLKIPYQAIPLIEDLRSDSRYKDKTVDQLSEKDLSDLKEKIAEIKGYDDVSKVTKFINVKFDFDSNTQLFISSSHNTDFTGTNFEGVRLNTNYSPIIGKNLDLTGAIINDEKVKTGYITQEQIKDKFGDYLAKILVLFAQKKTDGEKAIITITSDCKRTFFNKEYEEIEAAPVEKEKLTTTSSFYQNMLRDMNVEFVVLDENDNANNGTIIDYDYRLDYCQIPDGYTYQMTNPVSISGKSDIIFKDNPSSKDKIQTLGRAFGVNDPIALAVSPPAQCSPFATVMCENGAMDVMIPLNNYSKYPARLNPLDGLGIQDINQYMLIFDQNPNKEQKQDIVTTLAFDQTRIIKGNDEFDNIANISSESLPKGTKYVVLDNKEAIGTCFAFPCDEYGFVAQGIEEGRTIVFYKKDDQSETDIVLGTTMLCGGRSNKIFVDGKEINITRAPKPDTLIPEPDTLIPEPDTSHHTLSIDPLLISATVASLITCCLCVSRERIGSYLQRRNIERNNEGQHSTEMTQRQPRQPAQPQLSQQTSSRPQSQEIPSTTTVLRSSEPILSPTSRVRQ